MADSAGLARGSRFLAATDCRGRIRRALHIAAAQVRHLKYSFFGSKARTRLPRRRPLSASAVAACAAASASGGVCCSIGRCRCLLRRRPVAASAAASFVCSSVGQWRRLLRRRPLSASSAASRVDGFKYRSRICDCFTFEVDVCSDMAKAMILLETLLILLATQVEIRASQRQVRGSRSYKFSHF